MIDGDPIEQEKNWNQMKQMNTDMAYILNIPDYNDVIIAIIDNGIDYKHPYLKNVRWWVNTNETLNGIDDDGNGLIDDGLIGGGYDFGDMDTDPMPDRENSKEHGTSMAGVIVSEYVASRMPASKTDLFDTSFNKQEGIFQKDLTTLFFDMG